MNSQAYETLNDFFTAYLTKRNLKKTLDHVTDQIISLGTGAQEVALNKEEFHQLLLDEFAEMPFAIGYKIENYRENICGDGSVFSFCNVIAEIEDDDGSTTSMETRLTTSYCKIEDKFLISSLHMSTATAFQETDEFFPLKFGKTSDSKMSAEAKQQLLNLIKDVIPGGIMGGYLEPELPLYVINDEMLKYLGYTFEELVEETGSLIINIIHPDDRDAVYKKIMYELARGENYSVNYRLLQKSGDFIWVNDKGKLIMTADGREAIISVILDISETVNAQEMLRQEAIHDSLTQILNRREGIRLIEHAMISSSRGILMMLDIDNFKNVNDIYGHQAGDQVLKYLAGMLSTNVRSHDIAARLGGDEFIIYLAGHDNIQLAEEKLSKLSNEFFQHYAEIYPRANLSLSAGLTPRKDLENFNEIYARADNMLYEAKKDGKNKIVK